MCGVAARGGNAVVEAVGALSYVAFYFPKAGVCGFRLLYPRALWRPLHTM